MSHLFSLPKKPYGGRLGFRLRIQTITMGKALQGEFEVPGHIGSLHRELGISAGPLVTLLSEDVVF